MEIEKRLGQKGRARGRPRKASSTNHEEDKRERAREAQKNYQSRKQADNESLKERVMFLERAIESMSTEFVNFSDKILASRAQNPVLNELKMTTQRILEIAQATESKDGPMPLLPIVVEEGLDLAGRSSESESIPQRRLDQTIQGYVEELPGTIVSMTANAHDMAVIPASKWSPRIGYGLIGALPGWDPTPETLWTHYSVAGANSFAMRIYSDAVRFLLMLIRGQIVMPGILPHVGRYRFRHEDPQLLAMHLIDHLGHIGVIEQAESAPYDEVVLHGPASLEMTTLLRRSIFKDVRKELGSIEGWVDPFNAQKYLIDRWQIHLTSDSAQISTRTLRDLNMQKPFERNALGFWSEESNSWIQDASLWEDFESPHGEHQSDIQPQEQEFKLVVNAQPLAQSLVRESICFGEGPRFFKGNIDKAVVAFLSSIPTAPDLVI